LFSGNQTLASSPDQSEKRVRQAKRLRPPSYLVAADLCPIAACREPQDQDDWQPNSNAVVVDCLADSWLLPAPPPTALDADLTVLSPRHHGDPARSDWPVASRYSSTVLERASGASSRTFQAATAEPRLQHLHSTSLAVQHFTPEKALLPVMP
jgi:hypothetical protein